MNGSRAAFVRALRGPIVLIALGVLFALDYFWRYPFHMTWPVLLIVYGLMKLLERVAVEAPPPEYPTGGPL